MLPSRASRLVQRATRLPSVSGLKVPQPALARPLSVVAGDVPNRRSLQPVSQRYFSATTGDDKEDDKPEVVNGEVVDDGSENKSVPPPEPEKSGEAEKHEFMAETRQLLDIVTNSIYTDKDVFLRELVSNASDALEKLRHTQVMGEEIQDPSLPLEIRIFVNEAAGTITLQDTGFGMTREEMVQNLGTIARSGSKAFAQEMASGEGGADASGIIGQFGVGFYSAFMVADKVEVFSKKCTPGSQAYCWTSTGTGAYEINEASEVPRGSTIVMHLKDSEKEFAKSFRLKSILQKHSNFVNFPIFMDDVQVNMVQAIWAKEKQECTEEDYVSFYKFIANAFDEPTYTLHYRADAPIELKTLLFFPSTHMEKYGMARLEPSVSLYSRKVLIESASPDILPDWLRFVKGVVDSEDLPLSITREKMQDTKLLRQINEALTRRIIRFLDEMARKDREGYNKYFKEFGGFLKEGVCTDFNSRTAIAKLLRFQSSKLDDTDLTSLDEYISRCPPEQNQIYFLCAGSRESALSSPYAESFKKSGTEFLILINPIDEMVMSNLEKYNDKDLVGADRSSIDLDKEEDNESDEKTGLSKEKANDLIAFLKVKLGTKTSDITITNRLVDSPAIITDHESVAIRRMMQAVNEQASSMLGKQKLAINPKHPLMVSLENVRHSNEEVATLVAEQMFDNALVAAGLMDKSETMLPRLNNIMMALLTGAEVPSPENKSEEEK